MNRDAFEKFCRLEGVEPTLPAGSYQRCFEFAWNASRAQALEEAASLFPQPYMEYFGSDIQETIRALAQGGMK